MTDHRFNHVRVVHPALLAVGLESIALCTGRLVGGAFLGLLLGHMLVFSSLAALGIYGWRRRERTLVNRTETQLLLMTAHAEAALRRGEVLPCASCQRPVRRGHKARCHFCGAVDLPALR